MTDRAADKHSGDQPDEGAQTLLRDEEGRSGWPSRKDRSDATRDRRNTVRGSGDGSGKDKDEKRNRNESNDREDGAKDKKDNRKSSKWPLILLALAVVAAIGAGIYYWLSTRGIESTDDAYTDGNSVIIAPKIAGYVSELNVSDNTFVREGQVLYKIDPRDQLVARDQAAANLSMARAQLSSSEVNLEMTKVKAPATLAQALAQLNQARAGRDQAEQNDRRQRTVDARATTQSNIDQANATLRTNVASVDQAQANVRSAGLVRETIQTAEDQVKQSQAQVAQAEANLAQAEVNLTYTVIKAPQDGQITQRNVNLGNYVQAGQQSFYVVAPVVWVTANFKETQLDRMRPGQPVTMTVDAYPDLKLDGHVESIQQGSGAQFSAFPPQNATGNFVKIVRRVPVKILIDRGLPQGQTLPLGISVIAKVDVR